MIGTKKTKKQVSLGIINIKTTSNNIIITICDSFGNALCWSSAGTSGFEGKSKATVYAAQLASKNIALKALEFGILNIKIIIKGSGCARETCLNIFILAGFKVLLIKDQTPIAHNGCRPPKRRRV